MYGKVRIVDNRCLMGFSLPFTKTGAVPTLAIMLATLWIPSCTPTENKKAAEEAVVDFHQKLNSARFREIYDSSDTEFKNAISEPDAVAYFNAVNGKLGPAKNSELRSWR